MVHRLSAEAIIHGSIRIIHISDTAHYDSHVCRRSEVPGSRFMRQFQSNALCFKLYAIGFDIATIFQEIKNCVFEDKFQEWDTDDLPRRSYTDQYGSYTDLPRQKRMITDKVGLRFQVPGSCDSFNRMLYALSCTL